MKTILLSAMAVLVFSFADAQIMLGLTNDFEDGTTQGWSNGNSSPNPPTNIPTGGPDGMDDNFLEETSAGGGGAGSKLVMFNEDPSWLGDYNTAEVQLIIFDVKNPSANDLFLRIGLEGGSGDSEMVTTEVVQIGAGQNDWQEIVFDIRPGAFTITDGANDAFEVLEDVKAIRILSNPNVSYVGETIDGAMHFDNIFTDAFLGVNDAFSTDFSVFPNPAQNTVQLNSEFELDSFTLYGLNGNVVLEQNKSEVINVIDLSTLSSGVYFLKVSSGAYETVRKIVKR